MERGTGGVWTSGFSSDLPEEMQPGRLQKTTEQLILDEYDANIYSHPKTKQTGLKFIKQQLNFQP